MGYRDPSNYGYTQGPQADSIEELSAKVEKLEKNPGGTVDYSKLENKPEINGVELEGNKTTDDLKIQTGGSPTVEGETLVFSK